MRRPLIPGPRTAGWGWLFGLLIFLGLSACAPVIMFEQPARTGMALLTPGSSLGQTLTADYAGLQGIVLYLKPVTPGDGQLRLHLRASPNSVEEITSAVLPSSAVDHASFYRFAFPVQIDSNQKDYYFFLTFDGEGSVRVGSAKSESYPDGALYRDHLADDGQLTFRLVYARETLLTGLLREGLTWLGWLAIGLFLFILPGWGLLRLLWPAWDERNWAEKLGLSAGLSLAIYPVLFLWAGLAGLRLGSLYAWLPPIAGAFVLIISTIQGARSPRSNRHSRPKVNFSWADFSLLVVLGLIVLTRFWALRGLQIPMWGDSYQHTLMAQLIIDHGGLFNS